MPIVHIQEFFKQEEEKQNFVFIIKSQLRPQGSQNFEERKGYIPVDATITENYTLSSVITDHEVQDGGIISDHIHIKPERVTIKAIVSESPVFFYPAALQALVDFGVKKSFDIVSGATGYRSFARRISPVLAGFEKYAREFFSSSISSAIFNDPSGNRKGAQRNFWEFVLKDLMYKKELFSIQSGLQTLDNVFFESITFDRNYKIGDSLVFNCTLKQVRVVSSNIKITGKPGGENNDSVDRGAVAPREVNVSLPTAEDQGFPSLPVGAVEEIVDKVRIPLEKAKEEVVDFVEERKKQVRDFTGSVIRSISNVF